MKKLIFILLIFATISCECQIPSIGGFKPPVGESVLTIKYGYLYNHFAVRDARNIANTGWAVPSNTNWNTLVTYCGGTSVAGGKLKETGDVYWTSSNIGNATNDYNFSWRGNGNRNGDGSFSSILTYSPTWTLTVFTGTSYWSKFAQAAGVNFTTSAQDQLQGKAIRLMRAATAEEQLLPDGTYLDNYIGNDLRAYKVVKIGTQAWTAENLAETKYRNGDLIPIVTDATEWAALTTGAMSAYDNDISNVFE